MPLDALHVILTYRCNQECRHCFVFGGPYHDDVFTRSRLHDFLNQLREVPSVETVYFEGGEPFLYYPLLLDAVDYVTQMDLDTCVVTNGYWLSTEREIELYLRPLVTAGLTRIQVSLDALHGERRLRRMRRIKRQLEKQCERRRLESEFLSLTIPEPNDEPVEARRGETITGGVVEFRGRAATELVEEQATWLWSTFDECPHELLEDPRRVHVDPHGHVHLCQGLLMGNMSGVPLKSIMEEWKPADHPIVGPLLRGGPAALVTEHGLEHEEGYADSCHLCYSARLQLLERYPEWLGPPSVYGARKPA